MIPNLCIQKTIAIWHLATWLYWCFRQFRHSRIEVLQIAQVWSIAETLVITLSF
jgi:hypothetical protein